MTLDCEERLDLLLREAYSVDLAPGPEWKDRLETALADRKEKRRPRLVRPAFLAAAAAALVLLGTGAYAAARYLRAGELAELMDVPGLAELFEGEAVTEMNETVTAGDYTFSLRAVSRSAGDVYSSRGGHLADGGHFYAVVAVTRTDVEGMEEIPPREFSELTNDVTVTPLVRGHAPWHVNGLLAGRTLLYAQYEGVAYIVADCADFTCFADRGLYLGVCTGRYVGEDAFLFDETTGAISPDPAYEGASAVFELPVDEALADQNAARTILDLADSRYPNDGVVYQPDWDEPTWQSTIRTFLSIMGEPVPGTERTLIPDENGLCLYETEYGGEKVTQEFQFGKDQWGDTVFLHGRDRWAIPFDDVVWADVDAQPVWGVRMTAEEDGTVTTYIVVMTE